MSDQDISAETPSPPQSDPSPASASPSGGAGAGDGGVTVTVETEKLEATTVNAVGSAPGAMFVGAQYFGARESKATVRRFSCRDGLDVSEADEQAICRHFHGSDVEVETLVTHLSERRVLLLSAERGAGKLSAAIYLGMQLRQEHKCSNATVLADSLDRQVRIDVRHLAERDKGLAGRVVIFRKPFGRADPDLARLFEKTDRSGWEQLGARLRQQNAYLVFTADPDEAAAFRERAAALGLLRELLPHPRTLLEEGLDERLRQLQGSGAAEEPLAVLRNGCDRLLTLFQFTSSLAEFVDFYVDHYRPDLSLDDAVARFHDTSEWLLQELEREFESWTFGFTLALAQCVRDAQGIAWLDFDRLHRRVRQWLRRDLNPRAATAAAAPAAEDDEDEAEIHPALSEVPLLRRCRAEVVKDSSTLADVIQFRDGAPPRRLWTVILERHRRALTTILPGLRDLAENRQEDLRSLRILAAQILGRIGEVDPQRMVVPLVDRWVRSEGGRHHMAIGPLYEGVMGSGSERYRALCFRHLKQVHRGAASGDKTAVAGLHAAIGAYSWIGDYDLPLAMRELGAIAREHLAPMIGDVQQLARWLGELESEFRKQDQGEGNVDDLLFCHELLRDLMGMVYKQKAPALLGMQGSIVSLCLTSGPVPVFREMRRWVAEGGWKTGVLIGLMFLHESGIANALKASKVEVGTATDGPSLLCNPLVAAAAAGEEEVRQTARFLGDMYENLATPHMADAKLLRFCRDSLQRHLLDWVRDALPVAEYAASMRSLLLALAQTHEGRLRAPLVQLLARREFRDPDEPRLREFAASVQL